MDSEECLGYMAHFATSKILMVEISIYDDNFILYISCKCVSFMCNGGWFAFDNNFKIKTHFKLYILLFYNDWGMCHT